MSRYLLLLLCFLFPLSGESRDFNVPSPGYVWSFPSDHVNHPDYAVEWWYFTGHLLPEGADPADGEAWIHLELTFFRNSLPGERSGELYFSHLALSGDGQPFAFGEKIARGTLGEAGSEEEMLHVWLDDWKASRIDSLFLLEAYDPEVGGVRLIASTQSDPVLHGEQGYSPRGPGGSDASYYYSLPFLDTSGWYLPRETADGTRPALKQVKGRLWMDHEFGNQQLGSGLVGWDWWGMELPGGDALMFYRIRREDGSAIEQSEGTFISRDGTQQRIHLEDIQINPLSTWTSPASGATYPHGWEIQIPKLDIELRVQPVRMDQELRTDRSTRVTYYEGAVTVERKGYTEKTYGFVELVGYNR